MLTPRNLIILAAGLVGLFIDRIAGVSPKAGPLTDDLTLINGIGPTYARRLNEAGIVTFAQLAGLSSAEVLEIVHAREWQADAYGWIDQAKSRI